MCNSDGTVPYTPDSENPKCWKSITTNEIVYTLPIGYAQNFNPIKIRYEMSEPIVSPVTVVEPGTSITVFICLFIIMAAIFCVYIVISVLCQLVDLCSISKLPFKNWRF